MEKQKKINREFLISDSTVNSYGFRLLTLGYQIDEFKKNPIGYHMHTRDAGVVVKWEDLRVDGDRVLGKPVINMSHPRAQQTVDEIENGFLNAASVGHIMALEISDDPELMLPGQTGPTVTKWYNRECSLVDIGGNFNSIALFDKDDNPINLADFNTTKIQKPIMKQIFFTPVQLQAMNLKADASEIEISAAFNDLVAKAAQAKGFETKLNDLQDQVCKDKVEALLSVPLAAKTISDEVANTLRKDYATNPEGLKVVLSAFTGKDNNVTDQLATALAEKKITVELKAKLEKDYKDKPVELKDLLASMPTYKGLAAKLGETNISEKRLADLSAKSFDDLMESGESEELMKNAPEVWAQKKKEAGVE